ncbi:MAG: hypothetical protein DHS20C21_03160 [Gemmatimonadota bacterium]|nr:MAG: hypothetical protein DHS20C21_03160 [Gemmatimonadota bacterium]
MRKCNKCEAEKPEGEFRLYRRFRGGRHIEFRSGSCKDCTAREQAAWKRARNPSMAPYAGRRKKRANKKSVYATARLTALEKFASCVVEKKTGCKEWIGPRDRQGYGHLNLKGKSYRAHRWIYERWHGPLPQGLVVRHLCHNPSCVNLEHLAHGSQKENLDDSRAIGRMNDQVGSNNGFSKLDEEKVQLIRARSEAGERVVDLARSFGVSRKTIRDVLDRRRWSHVS